MPSAVELDVGVVEDDDRRLAAELEMDPLQVGGGGRGHLHPGPDAAGDRDHRRDRVRDQGPAGVAVPAHDVEHAGREVLGQDLGQQQRAHRAWCRTA